MKKIYVLFVVIFTLSIVFIFDNTTTHSSSTGAPAGYTNSPSDGENCATSCHGGFAVNAKAGMISSDIPASGYVPGSTYTITTSIAQTGISKWGFQISPQDKSGNLLGSISIVNNQTKIESSKYVTHTFLGTSGAGSKSWSFKWTAPIAGTGDASFYASVMAANGKDGNSGDQVYTDVNTIKENTNTTHLNGIYSSNSIAVYPNPVAGDMISIKHNSLTNGNFCRLRIIDLKGKVLETFENEGPENCNNLVSVPINILKAGVYLLELETKTGTIVTKIIRN